GAQDIERMRDILVVGNDDERQDLLNELVATVAYRDYSVLRDRLVEDLKEEFHPQKAFRLRSPNRAPAIRSWMLSALGCISTLEHREALKLLRNHLDEGYESDEMVRYWTLGALYGMVGDIPREWMKTRDQLGLVPALWDAILLRRYGDVSCRERLLGGL